VPELPDLVHIESKLRPALTGRRILAARTGDPTVLRLMIRTPLADALVGRTVQAVDRRGHFTCFSLDGDLLIAVNLMLAGRFFLVPAGDKKLPRALALALEFEGGQELRIVDEKRMAKVYITPPDRVAEIPQLGTLGVEILSPAFTAERFASLIKGRRDQVRQFLMDKSALASIGNAYADEVLFAARLHPKTFCNRLAPDEAARLYPAIVEVIRHANEEIARRDPPLENKLRDFLAVRGRGGKPCKVCGTTIREVRVGDGDACFCPTCQPAARKLFVDWGKLPPKEQPAPEKKKKAARRPR
jgi:formamidopyrimidine-DNA glycosylase